MWPDAGLPDAGLQMPQVAGQLVLAFFLWHLPFRDFLMHFLALQMSVQPLCRRRSALVSTCFSSPPLATAASATESSSSTGTANRIAP